MNIKTLNELLNMEHTEVPFLWGQIIPKVGITFLTGSSDCNKSTFLRQLILSIGVGDEEFLGLPLNIEHGKALYISTEDDIIAMSVLLKMQTPEDYCQACQENVSFQFEHENLPSTLDSFLTRNPVDAVILDTWTDAFGAGDINQSNLVRNNLNKYSKLAQDYGCSFIMVHHKRKGSEGRPSNKGEMLGSQAIEAKARTVIELRKETPTRRRFKILKGNYTPESVKDSELILEIDENMVLSCVDNRSTSTFDFKSSARENAKVEMTNKIIELKGGGSSFKQIKVTLDELYESGVPGITTIKTWYNKAVSQLSSLGTDPPDQNDDDA